MPVSLLVVALLSTAPDAPMRERQVLVASWRSEVPVTHAAPVVTTDSATVPDVLQNARRLSSELRYEEAMVEYQRYLNLPNRPIAERARAELELGFVHLLLGDERSAQLRAFEALSLDPTLRLPPAAPTRLEQFLASMREQYENRTRLELRPSCGEEK